jgi:hypothetical protein
MHNIVPKIVVFDMDETLGYFVQFGMFWDSLNTYIKSKNIKYTMSSGDFNDILDLYPEFIRPNIISVLNYLKHKKINKECEKVMIYTNNQGPKGWVNRIIEYFEFKLKYKLIDHIIGAFKINGEQFELNRTSHNKTYDDFVVCSKVPTNAQICFIDDVYHPEMSTDNVYYIKVLPYTHDLQFKYMINTFIKHDHYNKLITDKTEFENFMNVYLGEYHFNYIHKNKDDYEIDKIITKKMMMHLQRFFKRKAITIHKKQSQRIKSKSNANKTLKIKNKYHN